MSQSKSSGKSSTHRSTSKGSANKQPLPPDPESLIGYAKLLKLRSLAESTQADYLRYVRRIATRHGGDPAGLEEAQVREHLLHLKEAHGYSQSAMRTAVSALSGYYNRHLGRAWKLFDLVSSPSAKKLPMVLTREEVARLFSVVRTLRFLMIFRFIYACGLRIGEAVQLEVGDLRIEGRVRIRLAKGQKDREVPVPPAILQELREYWKTHRHPKFIFPGVGRGWRDGVARRGFVDHRQMQVDQCGLDPSVPEIRRDQPDAHAFIEHVSRVRMPQRVHDRALRQARRRDRQAHARLNGTHAHRLRRRGERRGRGDAIAPTTAHAGEN